MSSLSIDNSFINSILIQNVGVSTPTLTIDAVNNISNFQTSVLNNILQATREKDFNEDTSPFVQIVLTAGDDGFLVKLSDWGQLFVASANEDIKSGELTVTSLDTNSIIIEDKDTLQGRSRGEWKRITPPIPKGNYRISNKSSSDCSITHIYAAPVNDINKRQSANKIVRKIVEMQLTSALSSQVSSIDPLVFTARVQSTTDSVLSSTITSIISDSITTGDIKTKIDVAKSNNSTSLSTNDLNIAKNQLLSQVMNNPTITTVVEKIKSDVGSTSQDVEVTINNVIKEKTYSLSETMINDAITNSDGGSTSLSTTGNVIKNGQTTSTQGKTVIIPDPIVVLINNFTSSLTGESNIVRWEQLIVDNIQNEPASNIVYLTEQIILGIEGYDYDSAVTLAQMVVAMHSQL